MKYFTAIVEKDSETGLFVGYVPGINGAHSQGETLEELNQNLKEVLEMLANGMTPAQIEEDYPTLGPARIRACLLYAQALLPRYFKVADSQ